MEKVTLVKKAIHNPDDPRHFMRIKEPQTKVTARLGEVELAHTSRVLKVQEAGFDLYDPVYYFPKSDVLVDALERTDKTSHCPLKGDTEYYTINVNDESLKDAAWHYHKPYERSEILRDHIAFDQAQVQVVEHVKG